MVHVASHQSVERLLQEVWLYLRQMELWKGLGLLLLLTKGIYIAQVRQGHKCAMSAEMAVWLRNCLCLYSYLHN